MPLQDFYQTLAQASFTLFGLWIVVVQLRREDWRAARWGGVGAQLLTMHFALPGVMSLLAIADPGGTVLWRISFAALAVLGGAGVLLLGQAGSAPPGRSGAGWAALAVYLAIAAVALFVGPHGAWRTVSALTVEAVLLSLLLLVSLNSAFWMLFGAGQDASATDGGQATP